MVISNSSSNSITSSTMSRESAPTSSIKDVERVTCSLLTPRFSQTISMTRSSTEGTIQSSQSGADPQAAARASKHFFPAFGYVPQQPYTGQGFLGIRASPASGQSRCTHTKENDYMDWAKRKGEMKLPA